MALVRLSGKTAAAFATVATVAEAVALRVSQSVSSTEAFSHPKCSSLHKGMLFKEMDSTRELGLRGPVKNRFSRLVPEAPTILMTRCGIQQAGITLTLQRRLPAPHMGGNIAHGASTVSLALSAAGVASVNCIISSSVSGEGKQNKKGIGEGTTRSLAVSPHDDHRYATGGGSYLTDGKLYDQCLLSAKEKCSVLNGCLCHGSSWRLLLEFLLSIFLAPL